jgi:hypothetical protein
MALGLVVLGVGWVAPAKAQNDGGIGPAPREARAVIARALKALGGKEALKLVKTVVMTVDPKKSPIKERHVLRVAGRVMHYASRRKSGAGFDVVVGSGQAFLCDRNKAGQATFVEELSRTDTREGAYERDMLFMPFVLMQLMGKDSKMDYRGRNSKGHEIIRARINPPKGAKREKPFTIRLRFHKDTHLPLAAMGIVPLGQDKGKKRYCEYRDYVPVRFGRYTLKLPKTIDDQRGKGLPSRTFSVRWQINANLPAALFVRPRLKKDEE